MGIKDSSLWAREILSFLETAKNGSINGTAEANAMKQSNLSRTLKSLEEKLKCQLLERGYNGVRLTENGREVFKVACDLDKVIYKVKNFTISDKNVSGKIRLWTSDGLGTGDDVEALISKKNPFADFDVVSLPEFLREGFAVHDFFHPDRIVVGANTEKAKAVIKELYKPFEGKTNMLFVKRRSSETIKYASNAFLAIKIHYINEMANFCEKSGADISEVAQGMGLDTRIGNRFLNPGPGYGGSCFPKDTMAMAYMARQNEVEMSLITAAIKGNAERKKQMAGRILDKVKDVKNPKIAVLGLAFKDGTDDCRESPAMDIVGELLLQGADITAYDPKAMGTACGLLGNKISYADDMYACLKDADVLAILTEWNEFKALDLVQAAHLMRHKQIVDCRNLINAEQAAANGFDYQGIGK